MAIVAGCSQQGEKKEISVLLRMMPSQERFFREQIIPEFEKKNNCKVSLATFVNEWDIERFLKLEESKKKPTISLVKTPFEMTRVLVTKGYMKDLFSISDSDQVLQDLAEYHQLASGLDISTENLITFPETGDRDSFTENRRWLKR